jgi:hypothetical protein
MMEDFLTGNPGKIPQPMWSYQIGPTKSVFGTVVVGDHSYQRENGPWFNVAA